ncbi:MAG: 1,2-phenylacetyl-CoA epoxidase subunit PaaC [Pseudomonadota bacterium]
MSTLETLSPLENYAVRLGDDALILGHRLSEWTSNAPFLEEELALANTALDFIGRARMFFTYAGQLREDGTSEDDYAYQRDCRQYTNLLIYELPRGDFAFTMARQFMLDVFNLDFLKALSESKDQSLAAIAAKAIKESTYHLRRSSEWIMRLGQGTEESLERLQHAVNELWGFTPELFAMDELESGLLHEGIAVDRLALRDQWLSQVSATLREAGIAIPDSSWQVEGGRQGIHTEHLGHLLSEMQFVQRAYPGLQW